MLRNLPHPQLHSIRYLLCFIVIRDRIKQCLYLCVENETKSFSEI